MTGLGEDPGGPGKDGRFTHRYRAEPPDDLAPANTIEWSRRAIINLVTDVIPDQADALTLLGGHAVMLRTSNTYGLNADTTDGDFGVTPFAIHDEPIIVEALLAAGFEQRTKDRPGQWGRGRTGTLEMPGWNEKIDLLCGGALSGNTGRHRSVKALAGHGKTAVGLADGIELATVDRSLMEVPDLADPSRSAPVYVAGIASLICAKAYKLGERLGGTRLSRLRPKDAADLFMLLDAADPGETVALFQAHSSDDQIGPAVIVGQRHLHTVLTDPVTIDLFIDATQSGVGRPQLGTLLQSWRKALE